MDARTERRVEEAYERRARGLDRRELLANAGLTIAFVTAALALAVLAEPARELSAPLAGLLMLAFAVLSRIEFTSGAGFAVPTQLLFVPMLLLLPTPVVPLVVAAALVLSSAWSLARAGAPLNRAVLGLPDAIFALAPAFVIVAAGAQVPAWEHWPVYVAALAAQLALDAGVTVLRARVCVGLRARDVLPELRLTQRVDVLLAPVGLLTAVAAAEHPYLSLLVLPLGGLLGIFAREREARIEQTLELGRAYRGTALLLRDLLEDDDEYTGRHTEDVVELAGRVADELRVDEDVKRATELGALLHDIGKIHVPDEIINKPGPLDEEEWAIMRTHTVEGQKMLDRVGGLLGTVGVVVRASHERWDGKGYPDGLRGEEIPLAARIVSACDAYNAMTTDRSYRKAMPVAVAIHELRENAGTQFDAAVVEALIAAVRR
jgi:putative nucleotidyltransferase with HDIG domain